MRVLLTCDTRIFFSSNRSPMLLASAINKLLMTHRFSIFTLASLLLLVCVGTSAKKRTFNEAKAIAQRQATSLGATLSSASIETARRLNAPSVSGGSLAYYVFPHDRGKGFTIVSGDDQLPEIVAYSDRGSYDVAHLPDGYKMFLELYSDMVDGLAQGQPSAVQTASQAQRRSQAKAARPVVAPLLGDRMWNQYAPFNNLCPKDGTKQTVTGCVATALAQVFAYWRFPEALMADIPAYTTHTKRLSVPAIEKGEPYDWDRMLDIYEEGYYSQEEADAVAKLMLHCGAALQMDYTSSGSGANIFLAKLTKYFGYDAETMQEVERDNYSLEDWMNLLDAELQAKRPVMYSGNSSTVGHQFVCDGSDGDGLYHINWGWGGYQDGYFDISLLNPDKGGAGSGSDADGYTNGCRAIIGLQPGDGTVTVEPLLLVSATTNAEPGEYERENATIYGHTVEAPLVKDGDAIFTYGIQNNGEPTSLMYRMDMWGYPSKTYQNKMETTDLPGNGAITYVSTSVLPEEFDGDRSITCIFNAYVNDMYDYLPSSMDEWKLYILDPDMKGYSYRMNPAQLFVYVAGDTPSAIQQVGESELNRFYGDQGELVVIANRSGVVPVFGLDGRKVCEVNAVGGSTVRVPLKAGVYIVKGRKVVVR